MTIFTKNISKINNSFWFKEREFCPRVIPYRLKGYPLGMKIDKIPDSKSRTQYRKKLRTVCEKEQHLKDEHYRMFLLLDRGEHFYDENQRECIFGEYRKVVTVEQINSIMKNIEQQLEPLQQERLKIIDEIEKNMFVSVGGNGHAAKSSDHIGFISAKYITTGQWDKNLNRKKFTLKENI